MSHEIRTPMNAVLGMTNLLIDKGPRPDQQNYLDGIQKSSDTLLHIINDILDLSKIEEGKMELEHIDFSIRELVVQVRQTLNYKAEEKGLQLMVDIDKDVPDILVGDPTRLNQVLINLGGNAIKFTEKGSVTIEVSSEQLADSSGQSAGRSEVENPSNGLHLQGDTSQPPWGEELDTITFKVIDTGIGIPEDKLKAVFESFSQAHVSDSRKYGGTGLGLSISRQLVDLMGGEISIESEVGVGTEFSFTLNLPEGSTEGISIHRSVEQLDGSILNGLKILIADDNEYNRIVAHDSLKAKADVTIALATNGMEVVTMLGEGDYDIVLMDVQMPVMDGYEATRVIRDPQSSVRNHHIPVIALTASVIRSDLDKCRQAGMDDYVPKPFKIYQLISAIAKASVRELKFLDKKRTKVPFDTDAQDVVTDLTYLQNFCEGDKTRMQKYINMFLSTAPVFIEKLNDALGRQDLEEIASLVHGYKSNWIMMGMNEARDLALVIEQQCKAETLHPDLEQNTARLMGYISNAVSELETFLIQSN